MVGVDIRPQPNYPYLFLRADVFEFLKAGGWEGFDFIHASPPCQRYSVMNRAMGTAENHPDLVDPMRDALEATGLPFVIENVPGAPLREPVQLCGSSFGLDLRRHRLFEAGGGLVLLGQPCSHGWQTPRFAPASNRTNLSRVVSLNGSSSDVQLWRDTMGIPWMTRDELTQAIPPVYTEFLGNQVLKQIRRRGAIPGLRATG